MPFSSDRESITEENMKFDYLVSSFHSEPITGIDICVRKALIATCSSDRTLRIWNYQDHSLE